MKSKRIIFVGVPLCIVIIGVCVRFAARREPTYQDRPLSSWIEDFSSSQTEEQRNRAVEAVQQIGTNALPFLIEDLCARDTRTRTTVHELASKQHLLKVSFLPGFLRRQRARVGFEMLGPRAKPVVPELIAMLEATNSDIYAQYEIASVLGKIGPEAKAAVPLLFRLLTETNQFMRICAAGALGGISANPELVVPGLVENLGHSNAELRYMAAVSIGKFGARAASALAPLYIAAKDPDQSVREGAHSAIQKIEHALRNW